MLTIIERSIDHHFNQYFEANKKALIALGIDETNIHVDSCLGYVVENGKRLEDKPKIMRCSLCVDMDSSVIEGIVNAEVNRRFKPIIEQHEKMAAQHEREIAPLIAQATGDEIVPGAANSFTEQHQEAMKRDIRRKVLQEILGGPAKEVKKPNEPSR